MAISTTDVITPANTGSDLISNTNVVVYVTQGGVSEVLSTTSTVANPTFSGVETKYTDRFYNGTFVSIIGSIDGGGA